MNRLQLWIKSWHLSFRIWRSLLRSDVSPDGLIADCFWVYLNGRDWDD